jgi:hypothetical protein
LVWSLSFMWCFYTFYSSLNYIRKLFFCSTITVPKWKQWRSIFHTMLYACSWSYWRCELSSCIVRFMFHWICFTTGSQYGVGFPVDMPVMLTYFEDDQL